MPVDEIKIAQAIQRLDQAGYVDASRQTMAALTRSTNSPSGLIQRRLGELDVEANRLAEMGIPLTRGNPVYQQTLGDFQHTMNENGQRMLRAGSDIADAGSARAAATLRYGIRNTTDPRLYAAFDAQFAAPNSDQIRRAIGFIDDGSWTDEVGHFVNGSIQSVDDIAIRGLAAGWGPMRTAAALRRLVEEAHTGAANTLMRTLYLESSRKAQAAYQTANSRRISQVIRIEALDDRTCMACVALHGKVIWDSERHAGTSAPPIIEHHNGRGTTITQVRGVSRDVETGDAWFRRQTPAVQRQMIRSQKGFDAYQRGDARVQDFVQPYDNQVFGQMARQSSAAMAIANKESGRVLDSLGIV